MMTHRFSLIIFLLLLILIIDNTLSLTRDEIPWRKPAQAESVNFYGILLTEDNLYFKIHNNLTEKIFIINIMGCSGSSCNPEILRCRGNLTVFSSQISSPILCWHKKPLKTGNLLIFRFSIKYNTETGGNKTSSIITVPLPVMNNSEIKKIIEIDFPWLFERGTILESSTEAVENLTVNKTLSDNLNITEDSYSQGDSITAGEDIDIEKVANNKTTSNTMKISETATDINKTIGLAAASSEGYDGESRRQEDSKQKSNSTGKLLYVVIFVIIIFAVIFGFIISSFLRKRDNNEQIDNRAIFSEPEIPEENTADETHKIPDFTAKLVEEMRASGKDDKEIAKVLENQGFTPRMIDKYLYPEKYRSIYHDIPAKEVLSPEESKSKLLPEPEIVLQRGNAEKPLPQSASTGISTGSSVDIGADSGVFYGESGDTPLPEPELPNFLKKTGNTGVYKQGISGEKLPEVPEAPPPPEKPDNTFQLSEFPIGQLEHEKQQDINRMPNSTEKPNKNIYIRCPSCGAVLSRGLEYCPSCNRAL